MTWGRWNGQIRKERRQRKAWLLRGSAGVDDWDWVWLNTTRWERCGWTLPMVNIAVGSEKSEEVRQSNIEGSSVFASGAKSVQYQKSNIRRRLGSGATGGLMRNIVDMVDMVFLCLMENRVTVWLKTNHQFTWVQKFVPLFKARLCFYYNNKKHFKDQFSS